MVKKIIEGGIEQRGAQIVVGIEKQQIATLLLGTDGKAGSAADLITVDWFVISDGVLAGREAEAIGIGSTTEDVAAFASIDGVHAVTTAKDVAGMTSAETIISILGNETV